MRIPPDFTFSQPFRLSANSDLDVDMSCVLDECYLWWAGKPCDGRRGAEGNCAGAGWVP